MNTKLMSHLFFDAGDDLSEIEMKVLGELEKGRQENSHSFRYPTLITFAKNFPQPRTLVLRQVKGREKLLYFYTDKRSPKVKQLRENRAAALHFYQHSKKLQIRMGGNVELIEKGEEWEEHFKNLPKRSYGEYATLKAPGESLKNAEEEYQSHVDKAPENFILLKFKIEEMEALQLNNGHHFRISFRYSGTNFKAQWLMP